MRNKPQSWDTRCFTCYRFDRSLNFLENCGLFWNIGSAVTPVVTFTPNWRKIFIGESITMTCDVGSSGGEDLPYYWYKDGYWVHTGKIYTITSANTEDSGDYRCWASSERSDTARLDVVVGQFFMSYLEMHHYNPNSLLVQTMDPITKDIFAPLLGLLLSDLVILQVPLDVYEGDDVTLRCHHHSDYTGKYTKFYKDNVVIQNWSNTPEFHVGIVNMMNTGKYKCANGVTLNKYEYSKAEVISIQNLFEIPEIKVTPYPVVEGDEMTLTCDTSLSPLRPRTQLKFAFHKDGRNVGEFASYNQYGVQSAQVKDSGNYSCEASTATNSVKKRSQEILVEIKELFVNPTIIAIRSPTTEGDLMILICFSLSPLRPGTELQFAFYRDGRNVQEFSLSDQYGVQSTQLEDSGNYYCHVGALNGKVRKRSPSIPIKIKELFFAPVLNVSANEVLEGDNVTLMCDTSLSPLRQRTELQFAFYRDGRNVQEFSSSDQYGIQFAQLKDSGNYSCEVRSASNISKKSEVVFVFVQIREKSSKDITPIIIVTPLALLLVATFLLLKYRHKLHRPTTGCPHQRRGLQPEPQISPTHAAGESADDTEVTYTNLILHRVPEGSSLTREP
ncbi:Fc receptor-like protein 6, partial [Rana temporaria]|uniref:Fc receptor-like protein 6 n=1 Tax=Rana temporaria TaxID=8407 RepID=UPI001AAC55B3